MNPIRKYFQRIRLIKQRPHWNIYNGRGSWNGAGQCERCGQYAALQFGRMAKCPNFTLRGDIKK